MTRYHTYIDSSTQVGSETILGVQQNGSEYGVGISSTIEIENLNIFNSVGIGTTDPIAKLHVGAAVSDISTWVVTYGDIGVGTTDEYFSGVAFDSAGNIYTSGADYNNGVPYVVKFNNTGSIVWQKFFEHADPDRAYKRCEAVAVDKSDNSVYIAVEPDDTVDSIILVKLDSSGSILWQKEINDVPDTGYEYPTAISVTNGGDVYVFGGTNSQGAGSYDAFIIKFNSSGTEQWQRTIGGSSYEYTYNSKTAVDSAGNVYVVGQTNSQGAGSDDAFIIKFNSSGTEQWQRTIGDTSSDSGFSVAVDSNDNDNVYVYGYTNSQGAGSYDAFIIKFNSSGTEQWQRTIGGSSTDYGYGSIITDSNNNVYFTIQSYSDTSPGNPNIVIAKFDSSGNEILQRSLGGTGGEFYQWWYWGHDLIDIRNNELIVGGIVRYDPPDESINENGIILKTTTDIPTGTYGDYFQVGISTLTVGVSTLGVTTSTLTVGVSTIGVTTAGLTTALIPPSYTAVVNYTNMNPPTLYVDGFTGIKTTSPKYTLDVNGDINFTGTFYQNSTPFVPSISGITTFSDGLVSNNGIIRDNDTIDYSNIAPKLVYRRYSYVYTSHPSNKEQLTSLIKSGTFVSQATIANISAFSLSADSYAVEFVGYFYAATTGLYSFGVNSDDASDLFIDGRLVAYWYSGHASNSPGTPGGTQTSVYLNQGFHRLYTRFEEYTGSDSHEILYKTPGSSTWAVIPSSVLFHHPTDLLGGFGDNLSLMSGNLGIGTTNPTSKLQVDGDIRVSGVGTITNLVSTNLVGTAASITGVSTFRNGPVFIGSATSTGTLSQTLQVTGGAYVSGSVGVGTTNPTSSLHIIGSSIITGITTVGLGTTSAPSNSQLTFELTSNTNLRIKVRGTDGVLRSANITLA